MDGGVRPLFSIFHFHLKSCSVICWAFHCWSLKQLQFWYASYKSFAVCCAACCMAQDQEKKQKGEREERERGRVIGISIFFMIDLRYLKAWGSIILDRLIPPYGPMYGLDQVALLFFFWKMVVFIYNIINLSRYWYRAILQINKNLGSNSTNKWEFPLAMNNEQGSAPLGSLFDLHNRNHRLQT